MAASLTQEALAERAGMSARGISDLERGARTHPYRETVNLLVNALGLSGSERAAFLQSARRKPRVIGQSQTDARVAIPAPTSSLIGRDADVAAVCELLHDDQVRLVTLTGPGGVGKTRLALAVTAKLNGPFSGGRVFVDLSPLHQPANVYPAIAAALGLREHAPESTGVSLQRLLGDRRLLVVLDNYEHVLDAAPAVSQLLRASPGVKALVTSREALRLQGEREVLVSPLALPERTQEGRLKVLERCAAVQLFVERAAEADRHFRLTEENAAAVAAICQRLDGLPLAIELAAARIKVLSPAELLSRLEPRLPLLTGGSRDAPARQRTLRDTIAWSFDLLSAEEQVLFVQLSVFKGGWTLEAAEAAGGKGGKGDRGKDESVLDGLSSLVDKSLVGRVESPAGTRFVMLETVREFAYERLQERSGDYEVRRQAHATYYLALAEEASRGLVSAEQEEWLDRLDSDEGNLQAALDWNFERGRADSALRLTRALWRYWAPRGRLLDGRFWLERALSQEGAQESPADTRADAHNALGNLLGDIGEYALASREYERALALRQEINDADGVAGTLNNLGIIAMWLGDYERANALHQQSLEIRRSLHDRFGEALSLSNLGDVKLAEGEFSRARELQLASLRLREQIRDAAGTAYARYNLGEIGRLEGNGEEAARWLDDSLERFETLGDRLGQAYAEWSLGSLAAMEGNAARAADLLERALETRVEIGDQRGVVECLEALGLLALREGYLPDGARLLGIARIQREALSCQAPPSVRADHERALNVARRANGDTRIDDFMREPGDTAEALRLAHLVIDRIVGEEEAISR
jgi:predicted ATPase/Flp pilus assembly protein TadD